MILSKYFLSELKYRQYIWAELGYHIYLTHLQALHLIPIFSGVAVFPVLHHSFKVPTFFKGQAQIPPSQISSAPVQLELSLPLPKKHIALFFFFLIS